MACRVMLVRHGEALTAKPGAYCGQLDAPLSALGHQQAERLRARLGEEPLDAVYSSDLRRAARTAETVVAGRGVGVIYLPALREMCFGIWEGLSYEEIEASDPGRLGDWLRDPERCFPQGGESLGDMEVRVMEAWREITRDQAASVLVVCHGGPLRSIVGKLLGLPPVNRWSLEFHHCGVSLVEVASPTSRLLALNDTCHLRGLAQ